MRGNLVTDLDLLLAEAPTDATAVVFHTAVLSYVADPDERRRFAETVTRSRAVWLANEAPACIPGMERVRHPSRDGQFLLCRDGRPVAYTDPHGSRIDWLSS